MLSSSAGAGAEGGAAGLGVGAAEPCCCADARLAASDNTAIAAMRIIVLMSASRFAVDGEFPIVPQTVSELRLHAADSDRRRAGDARGPSLTSEGGAGKSRRTECRNGARDER